MTTFETESRAHQVAQGNYGLRYGQYHIERLGNRFVIRKLV